MADPDFPANPPEPDGEFIEVEIPAEFVKACEARGIDPAAATVRLLALVEEVAADAEQLFPDWDSSSVEGKKRFLFQGAMPGLSWNCRRERSSCSCLSSGGGVDWCKD